MRIYSGFVGYFRARAPPSRLPETRCKRGLPGLLGLIVLLGGKIVGLRGLRGFLGLLGLWGPEARTGLDAARSAEGQDLEGQPHGSLGSTGSQRPGASLSDFSVSRPDAGS